MHWREPVGTGIGTVGLVLWVGLGGPIGRAVASERHALAALALVITVATVFAFGGLCIVWATADEIDFWRRGYRLRQVIPKELIR